MINNPLTPFYTVKYLTKDKGKTTELLVPGTIVRLTYTDAEEEDDLCEIEVRGEDPTLVDHPCFRNNQAWMIYFGFVELPTASRKEKIYIEDISPTFDKNGVTIRITAHDKLASTKKTPSRAIYKNASFPEIAASIAKKNNLKLKIEKPNTINDIDPWEKFQDWVNAKKGIKKTPKTLSPEELAENQKQLSSGVRRYNKMQQYLKATGQQTTVDYTPSQKDELRRQRMRLEGIGINLKENAGVKELVANNQLDPERVGEYLFFRKNFITHSSVNQGNRTDKQLLKQYGLKQPGGPYIVVGHGDTLIIRKRNFNQKPIATYTYRDGTNELLTFNPETKNKSAQSGTAATGYTGWDPIEKSVYSGTIPDGDNPFVDGYVGNGGVGTSSRKDIIVEGQALSLPYMIYQKNTQGDMEFRYGGIKKVPDAVIEKPLTPEVPLEEKKDFNRQIISPSNIPSGNFAQAANNQAIDSIRKNPGSFTCIGNPILKSGKIVKIENVGKRFSTNYYLLKTTHEFEASTGYTTTCEICTNSSGVLVETTTEKASENALKAKNSQVGPSSNYNNRKIRIKTEIQ